MDYKTIGIVLLVITVLISAFMEWIKILSKTKRRELKTWLQISVAAILSIGLAWVAWSAFDLPGKIQAVSLYALLVYTTQYYLSMEVLKRIGKPVARMWMRSKGFSEKDIMEALDG
jgi:CDP-diglyceride synthetase